MLGEQAESAQSDLAARVTGLTAELQDLRASSVAAAQLAGAQHAEEVAMLRQKLEQAQGG